MDIKEYVSSFKNHPVLFVGSGFSLRYLNESFSWDQLLKHISFFLHGNEEIYLDLKADNIINDEIKYDRIAQILENDFDRIAKMNRHGKFEQVNDIFYSNMAINNKLSRMKIFISLLLGNNDINNDKKVELDELIKTRKNISSIITTNYDTLIERFFNFDPLIGNDILMSNPYGSVYKIHGCISKIDSIIITSADYDHFENKYELIRAQLLSLFIHNPIVFIGYSVGDENIRKILKTIFTYIEPNSEEAKTIKSNFLLVEYEHNSTNQLISDYDIVMDDGTTLKINKLRTDDYLSLYHELANLQLPVSAMDIRKVQNVVKQIYEGGEIKVEIVDDIDSLKNSEKVLAIGNKERFKYDYQRPAEMMANYFQIIEEDNYQLLSLIDKHTFQKQQFFPIFGFSTINTELASTPRLTTFQISKMKSIYSDTKNINNFKSINEIIVGDAVPRSKHNLYIVYGILQRNISLSEVERYLKSMAEQDRRQTEYKRILCAFDLMKYAPQDVIESIY